MPAAVLALGAKVSLLTLQLIDWLRALDQFEILPQTGTESGSISYRARIKAATNGVATTGVSVPALVSAPVKPMVVSYNCPIVRVNLTD
jgi:hypothetical protein